MYRPSPYGGGNVERYLTQELDRIANVLTELYSPHLRLAALQSEPDKPADGMIVRAGEGWNPGDGEGVYIYLGGWVKIWDANGMATDAFGRLKVAAPDALFDHMGEYGDNAAFWETSVTGSGGVSNVANQCSVRLTTGGTASGAKAVRQTRSYLRYQPGRSLNIETTFVMSAAKTNSTASIGYFDDNNGVFFQRVGSALSIVRRTNVSGTPDDTATIPQASWNVDPLDGTGPSGKTLNVTTTNILVIQLQFLGVGRVQVGFNIDGQTIIAHQFLNANNLSTVYMSTGCLPVRGLVTNTGTASGTITMDMICTSVSSGGKGAERTAMSKSNGTTAVSTTTTLKPLLSIRAATTINSITNRGHILPDSFSVVVASQIHEYQIIRNGSLSAASFSSVASTSLAEFDVSATGIDGGTVIETGYLAATASTRAVLEGALFRALPIVYTGLGNVQEKLTIAVRTVTSTGSAYAAINWLEEY